MDKIKTYLDKAEVSLEAYGNVINVLLIALLLINLFV